MKKEYKGEMFLDNLLKRNTSKCKPSVILGFKPLSINNVQEARIDNIACKVAYESLDTVTLISEKDNGVWTVNKCLIDTYEQVIGREERVYLKLA